MDKLTGTSADVVKIAADSLPLIAAFAGYAIADDKRMGTGAKAGIAALAAIAGAWIGGYAQKQLIAGLTLERVGALPVLRTRANLRRGYGMLTMSGCQGCGY
jgi:hypothetical protein